LLEDGTTGTQPEDEAPTDQHAAAGTHEGPARRPQYVAAAQQASAAARNTQRRPQRRPARRIRYAGRNTQWRRSNQRGLRQQGAPRSEEGESNARRIRRKETKEEQPQKTKAERPLRERKKIRKREKNPTNENKPRALYGAVPSFPFFFFASLKTARLATANGTEAKKKEQYIVLRSLVNRSVSNTDRAHTEQ